MPFGDSTPNGLNSLIKAVSAKPPEPVLVSGALDSYLTSISCAWNAVDGPNATPGHSSASKDSQASTVSK